MVQPTVGAACGSSTAYCTFEGAGGCVSLCRCGAGAWSCETHCPAPAKGLDCVEGRACGLFDYCTVPGIAFCSCRSDGILTCSKP